MTLIAQGAEAKLYKEGNSLIKERVKKGYRHEEIDLRIRKQNTRREKRLLEKSAKVINVPKVLDYDESKYRVTMEFIDGKTLRDVLDDLPTDKRKDTCKQLGNEIAKIHNINLIHGDLTTSNFILKDDKIFFIDFGLGFHSTKVEDKAVDLHLLKQAFESKHYKHFKESFNKVIEGYKKESKDSKGILDRFEIVEKRGRYKKKTL
ncbi:MAG: Kae1-associated serine/threonine protein kinase [Nanoarchaeota archaeon]|nr:Kae1-associated serine/threonine protein kinase [Nanoarchaeota archaeon]MCG2718577.1 Kae1-associated serine/threonine protein kinase [Nanoarchaeota archaeon]